MGSRLSISRHASWGALVAITCLLVLLSVGPARADGAVTVADAPGGGTFTPATVTITAGEQVVWTFLNGGHSVRATDGGGFDSHPDCRTRPLFGDVAGCANGGETFAFTFAEPGTYNYNCRIHGGGMTGTVVVLEAASTEVPTDEPTGTEEPTDEPSATATPSDAPTDDVTEDPTDEPTAEPTVEPSATATEEPTASPSETEQSTPTPIPTLEPLPSVSPRPEPTDIPSPTFEPFPPPREIPTPAPSPTEDLGVVAIGEDGGPSTAGRIVAGTVAGLLLAGTATAFGRMVLFGPPWT